MQQDIYFSLCCLCLGLCHTRSSPVVLSPAQHRTVCTLPVPATGHQDDRDPKPWTPPFFNNTNTNHHNNNNSNNNNIKIKIIIIITIIVIIVIIIKITIIKIIIVVIIVIIIIIIIIIMVILSPQP